MEKGKNQNNDTKKPIIANKEVKKNVTRKPTLKKDTSLGFTVDTVVNFIKKIPITSIIKPRRLSTYHIWSSKSNLNLDSFIIENKISSNKSSDLHFYISSLDKSYQLQQKIGDNSWSNKFYTHQLLLATNESLHSKKPSRPDYKPINPYYSFLKTSVDTSLPKPSSGPISKDKPSKPLSAKQKSERDLDNKIQFYMQDDYDFHHNPFVTQLSQSQFNQIKTSKNFLNTLLKYKQEFYYYISREINNSESEIILVKSVISKIQTKNKQQVFSVKLYDSDDNTLIKHPNGLIQIFPIKEFLIFNNEKINFSDLDKNKIEFNNFVFRFPFVVKVLFNLPI